MSKLRVLSGKDVIKILENFGFAVVAQKGSHVKLQREHGETKQTLTIPNHSELDKGTSKAIYNQTVRYVSEEDLKGFFYNND